MRLFFLVQYIGFPTYCCSIIMQWHLMRTPECLLCRLDEGVGRVIGHCTKNGSPINKVSCLPFCSILVTDTLLRNHIKV